MKQRFLGMALAFAGLYDRAFAADPTAPPPDPKGGTGPPSGGTGGTPPLNLGGLDPLQGKGFEDVVVAIANGLITIAVPIVGIMVLIGAFQIMTAGGSPEKVESGKKTIWYAVIGFAVVLVASSVVLVIRNLLQGK